MSSDPTVGFRFRLTHADGRVEAMMVDAERALIGNAAHCEVRLAPEEAAHEHVEVYSDAGTIYFATRAYGLASSLPTLNGATMVEGQWPLGSTLGLGSVQMTVELVDIGTPRAKPPFWVLLFAIPVVVILVTAVALARTSQRAEVPIPEAPEILPAKEGVSCLNVGADQRVALAAERLRIALAKRERSPFSPEDGIEAVSYFETAAACYRAAGMPAEADPAEQSADALRGKLAEDYRVRRVRLEHAYRVHDTPAVKRELNVLIPLTSQHRGAYTEWMAALDRAVTAELEGRAVGRLR